MTVRLEAGSCAARAADLGVVDGLALATRHMLRGAETTSITIGEDRK